MYVNIQKNHVPDGFYFKDQYSELSLGPAQTMTNCGERQATLLADSHYDELWRTVSDVSNEVVTNLVRPWLANFSGG